MDTRLSRRRLLQAGAAGAAGAALLPNVGCSTNAAGRGDGRPNVLVLIIDSLRPDHVGAYGSPQIQTPNVDALASRGLRFNRAFPEAMVTIPARRSIFTSAADLPVPELRTQPGARPEPRLAPDRGRREHLEQGAEGRGLLDRPGVGQPAPRLHQGLRAVPQDLGPLAHDRRPVGLLPRPRVGPDRARREVGAAVHARRPLHAGHAQVPRQHRAAARTRRRPARRASTRTRRASLERAQRRQPFAMVVDSFDPHEPWSPPREYIDLYSDPDYIGPGDRRHQLRLRIELHAGAVPPPARDLRRRGHHDRPLARALHGPLLRARPRREHRDRAAVGPRLPAR